jgi:hypothetical protein
MLRIVDVGRLMVPKNTSTHTVMNEYVNIGECLLDIIPVYGGEILKIHQLKREPARKRSEKAEN